MGNNPEQQITYERSLVAEIERLRAELTEAQDNYTRWHKAFMALKYGPHAPRDAEALASVEPSQQYNPETVEKILAAAKAPPHPVCCDRFPDCECPPERAADTSSEERS